MRVSPARAGSAASAWRPRRRLDPAELAAADERCARWTSACSRTTPSWSQLLEGLGFERETRRAGHLVFLGALAVLHPGLARSGQRAASTTASARSAPKASADDCLAYYYPGSCLVTARDIITLWVARMVLAGLYNLGDVPFSDVFIHANILDGKGERMSKSKGNGIDPVDIIERYGTDAMRYVLCDMQTGTQDIRLPVTAICPQLRAPQRPGRTPSTARASSLRVCDECGGEFDVLGTMPELPAAKLISERFEVGPRLLHQAVELGALRPDQPGRRGHR